MPGRADWPDHHERFRDILEIRRLRVGQLYDLSWEKPKPLVRNAACGVVPERVDVEGKVVQPLDLAEAERVVEALLAEDLEAVAVVLVHAYANGDHERQVGEMIEASAGRLPVDVPRRRCRRLASMSGHRRQSSMRTSVRSRTATWARWVRPSRRVVQAPLP